MIEFSGKSPKWVDFPLLQSQLRGIKKMKSQKSLPRPITVEILHLFLPYLQGSLVRVTVRAAFEVAVFALLRCGEFATGGGSFKN